MRRLPGLGIIYTGILSTLRLFSDAHPHHPVSDKRARETGGTKRRGVKNHSTASSTVPMSMLSAGAGAVNKGFGKGLGRSIRWPMNPKHNPKTA